jgi:hypothetical protein
MMARQGFPARGTALGCVLLSLFFSANTLAQDEESDPTAEAAGESEQAEQADQPETDPADADEAEAEKPAPLEAGAPRTAPVAPITLEALPGSAYPAHRVRGINGGSLWLNMHGHQWPYLPAVGEPGTARLGLSGSVWVDTSYLKVDSGLPATDPSIKEWRQQSRLVLRASPTYNAADDWFVQGQGEMVLRGAAPTRTEDNIVADDLYVRVGKWNRFDLTAGRFQGWEIYHLGMGLDLNTAERDGARTEITAPVDLYGVTYFWDRPNGPGRLAAHLYATDYLRFELMGTVGSSGLNVLGVRPVAVLDLGIIKVKGGAEYGKETPRQQTADRKDSLIRRGGGGTVQIVLDPVLEAGVAVAHALIDAYNVQGVLDAGRSSTTTTYGGFANVRVFDPLILGAGANYTEENNLKVDVTGQLNDIRSHLQIFGAAQYWLWDQLYIKGVFAYANAHVNRLSDPPPVADFRHKMLSGRIRLMYLF